MGGIGPQTVHLFVFINWSFLASRVGSIQIDHDHLNSATATVTIMCLLPLLLLSQDYRLNWRLDSACTSDIKRLCGGLCDTSSGQPCGGVVLQCLQVMSGLYDLFAGL